MQVLDSVSKCVGSGVEKVGEDKKGGLCYHRVVAEATGDRTAHEYDRAR
jgi:hypothetical protein